MGLPTARQLSSTFAAGIWRSLELHKHHRALGLASAPSGSRGAADIAKSRPVQPVTLAASACRAARCPLLRREVPGPLALCSQGEPVAGPAQILWDAGVTHYDVASIGEVRLVHETLPEAVLCFMHPVKAEEAIAEAYFGHGVKTFSLDTHRRAGQDRPRDVDGRRSGERPQPARSHPRQLGSCQAQPRSEVRRRPARRQRASDRRPPGRRRARHLLSCRKPGDDPGGFCRSDGPASAQAIVEAAVTVDIVDVGGGFPSSYPGMEPPPLETYFAVIHQAFEALPISYSAELWCEPGRALCAEYASVLVRVEKRRGDELYINDGAYGALVRRRAYWLALSCPAVREEESHVRPMEFSFYGPTCDDLDRMAGPFELPADVGPGDYIEVGMLGAYGCAMRTQFNGFGVVESAIVDDEPMASLYGAATAPARSNVVKL